jgi:hypothetical protein
MNQSRAWTWNGVLVLVAVVGLMLNAGCSRHVEVGGNSGNRHATQVAIEALLFVTDKYVADCGVPLPTNAPLTALIDDPGIPGWAGPYIRRSLQESVPPDAWGRDFRVKTDATFLVTITSSGRDGLFGTPDDIAGTKQCRQPRTELRRPSDTEPPRAERDWRVIAGCEKFVPKGSSKASVLRLLGEPTEKTPAMWHYLVGGDPFATATILFDSQGNVTNVTSSWAPYCR